MIVWGLLFQPEVALSNQVFLQYLKMVTIGVGASMILACLFFKKRINFSKNAIIPLLYIFVAVLNFSLLLSNFPNEISYITIIISALLGVFIYSREHLAYYLAFGVMLNVVGLYFAPQAQITPPYFLSTAILGGLSIFFIFNRSFNFEDDIANKKIALHQSKEFFNGVFANSPIGIAVVQRDNVFFKVNDAFCAMLGYTYNEMMTKSPLDFVDAETAVVDREIWRNIFNKTLSPYQTEKELITESGEIIWVDFSASVVKNNTQKSNYVLLILEDITKRKLNDIRRKEINDKLKAALNEIKEFNYVATYDLQTPLQKLTNYIRYIKMKYNGQLNGNFETVINSTISEADRVNQMIEDLLEYSRVNRNISNKIPINSEKILEVVLSDLKDKIEEKKAIVSYQNLPIVYFDEYNLKQIIFQLIDNAVKYCQNKVPLITIEAIEQKKKWLFKVQDNGVGIDEDDKVQVFRIFKQIESSVQESEGTGIGLAICKKIIERNGGEIWYESEIGIGTTFYFTIYKKEFQEAVII